MVILIRDINLESDKEIKYILMVALLKNLNQHTVQVFQIMHQYFGQKDLDLKLMEE